MKKFKKAIFWLFIIIVFLYTIDGRYNLSQNIQNVGVLSHEDDKQEFILKVRKAMLDGSDSAVFPYVGKVDNMEWFTEDVIDMVYAIDDLSTSSDYDYLKYKANSIYAHIVGFGNKMTISYEFEYNESYSETQAVDETIDELFKKWNMNELSDYKKIKKIHDFIIENASYDTDTTKYSAYDNLIGKSSTCQGYMSVAYKMFIKAGIPSRIITGIGNKDSHGWNIVELDGKWYNIDCTWDDPLTLDNENLVIYDYFLKSNEDFSGAYKG